MHSQERPNTTHHMNEIGNIPQIAVNIKQKENATWLLYHTGQME